MALSADQSHLESTEAGELLLGIAVLNSIKYLGVRMGNIFLQRRASLVASLHVSPKEHVVLLKTWALLTALLTARSYFPSDLTVKPLKIVSSTALGFNSWGVTLDHIAQAPDLGGYQLPTPKV